MFLPSFLASQSYSFSICQGFPDKSMLNPAHVGSVLLPFSPGTAASGITSGSVIHACSTVAIQPTSRHLTVSDHKERYF